MAKTATVPARNAQVKLRTNPFAVMTAAKIPETAGRERTNYGWEELAKPKQFKRIPLSMIDNARSSVFAFQAVRKKNYEEAKAKAEAAGEEALNKFLEETPVPPKFTTMKALDKNGRPLKMKKGGTVFDFVDNDSPEGEELKKDKRGNEIAAFYDVIRIE